MNPLKLDLDRYLRIPRLADLDVSPDGRFLVTSAARLRSDGTRFVRDLHRVTLGPTPGAAPLQLTRGDGNDHAPRYLADGSLLFLSDRAGGEQPEAEAGAEAEDRPATQLWHLPAAGEPRVLTRRDGGLNGFAAARRGEGVVFSANVHPGDSAADADRKTERERKKSGASGLVYDALPLRFWDRFYGPRYAHLFHAPSLEAAADRAIDLTPDATIEHDDLGFDISPEGTRVCAAERERDEDGRFAENLRLFDVAAGTSRRLTEGRHSYTQPRFSPDGRSVVAVFHENLPGRTGRQWLVEVPIAAGEAARALTRELDLWPEAPVYAASGERVFFVADERGHHPVFAVQRGTGAVVRLTRAGSHSDLAPAPAGDGLYAIASRFDRPPEVVKLEGAEPDQAPAPLTSLATAALAGVELAAAEALTAVNAKGRQVQSWLVRPQGTPPASGWPLLLWVHGGPLGAFGEAWHWRWNPQLFAARGHAVLLVNPRISTGFGQDFVEEGHARWGGEPFEDLMTALDHALEQPGLDRNRTAAMGGSFGGYMANWIAGHTDRFRCIVSHAGLWDLIGFHGTTDHGPEWEREFGGDPHRNPEIYERWTPHRHARAIRTPVLFVHGEKDYRVPVSEAYQAFSALQRLGVPARLLYFPDENHWIQRPPNIRQWHEAIWSWLERFL